MKILNFKKIDAFTKGSSSGNPAGYVLLDRMDSLTEGEMQKLHPSSVGLSAKWALPAERAMDVN